MTPCSQCVNRVTCGFLGACVNPVKPAREPLNTTTDELYQDAVAFLREKPDANVAQLQRRLRIGFPRAVRLMESLGRPTGVTTLQRADYDAPHPGSEQKGG